ncbi:single-stranded DNA-binding protein [uncultured Helcococcus sp.]|uniref:single-stranded DNA-binding protein n=1 Tax=uncultured Helcococcus sp. TaxID=1072508 RepID=UPI00262C1AA5|nr:single-stranded DNA-binding protein [uncultured Helcococcus sp.]
MNNVVLMGRLTRDPELRYVQTGGNTAVARFSLAVDKNLSREKRQEMESKGQPTADFINVTAWGRLGETVAKYSGKGLRLLVNGRIQTGSYEKDGERRYTTEVVAQSVEIIDWKDSNNSGSFNNSNSQASSADNYQAPIDDDFEYSADFDPTEDERIPF